MNMTSRALFQDLRSGAASMSLSCANDEWKEAWIDLRDAADKLEKLYAANEVAPKEFVWPEDQTP